MHELGVVFSVIHTVEDVAKENNVSEVSAVRLHLGEVSTVIPEYLTDCWNWAVKKTEIMKDARLDIEIIPAVTLCEDCGEEYGTVKYGKVCPKCGSSNTYLLRGNEFTIQEIEVC